LYAVPSCSSTSFSRNSQFRPSLSCAVAAGAAADLPDASATNILVVGLDGILQRSLAFSPPKGLMLGSTNTACTSSESPSGSGAELAVALSNNAANSRSSVCLVQLVGGKTGEALSEALTASGVQLMSVATQACTRVRTTLLDQRWGEISHILEPPNSAQVRSCYYICACTLVQGEHFKLAGLSMLQLLYVCTQH
jgi:hypothetical protein